MSPGAKALRLAGRLAALTLLCLPPALMSGLVRSAQGDAPVWPEAAQAYLFALILAFFAGLTAPSRREHDHRWSVLTPATVVGAAALLLLPPARESTALSSFGLGALWFFLLHLGLAGRGARGVRAIRDLGFLIALAGFAGFIPVAVLQWYERFSGEEAFAAAQAAVLAAVYLLLLLPTAFVARRRPVAVSGLAYTLRRRWHALALTLLAGILGIRTFQLYQASFFDPAPPTYPGISAESPFLCLPAPRSDQVYDGKEVFARLVANVAANPNKRAPDYGMLAITTGKNDWAQSFRETLLQEAAAGRFTGASNSVKYSQYEASLRAYYLPRVVAAFPALFSAEEEERLHEWFATINRRALTVEWSDWVYSAALGNRPTGLYENQENGAGLVANLIAGDLEDPGLAQANRNYLLANVRGWATGFRNTDDTVNYQGEWINNALFQALAGQPVDERRKSQAFEWPLLQALPSGGAPAYNYPNSLSLAGLAYLGAVEQKEPVYVWLAGRALDYTEAAGRYAPAQPGVIAPVDLQGVAPRQGSCLIYGDSGLPNRAGPLAPDKIVLRSGWGADDSYALLNLRFTGWHRYKGTNTVAMLSLGEPVVNDQPQKASFSWLPSGRSLLRDKRIGREDLSSVLVPSHGLASVVRVLSGIGSAWAQDPPWHARVLQFGQQGNWDAATMRVEGWHGWEHTRSVYLLHGGDVVVIADDAAGSGGEPPRLVWQLEGGGWSVDDSGAGERTDNAEVEQRVIVLGGPALTPAPLQLVSSAGPRSSLQYHSPWSGSLRAVTVFLGADAVGANVRVRASGDQTVLRIERDDKVEELPLF